jgi:hypothetical protein
MPSVDRIVIAIEVGSEATPASPAASRSCAQTATSRRHASKSVFTRA